MATPNQASTFYRQLEAEVSENWGGLKPDSYATLFHFQHRFSGMWRSIRQAP